MESKPSDKILEKKRRKKLLKTKKSRIILRNVSFKVNEDIIKEKFSKFGTIIEVNIPKDGSGKVLGFCFVGFDAIKSALKAIKGMNGKQLFGRTIAVDFALAKKRFQTQTNPEDELNQNQAFIKTEDIKEEPEFEDEENERESDDNQNGIQDSDLDGSDDEIESKNSFNKINPKILSDASEERTVFVRNLSFLTTRETLNELMTGFGPTEYTKICVDPFTDHSKGTAFVKFRAKDDANKCLKAFEDQENDFYLEGRQLNISLAVTRNKLKDIEEKRLIKDKDKRNLYLAKEGLIYPDSPAAEGVSQTDLAKRLALETKKRKMLQNNHYFVSRTRLCVHNLPENYDNKMLRKLFLNAVKDKSTQIIEAKIMFDRKKNDLKFGKSKGFGFVEFKEHVHALQALRYLNNNPNIFTPKKRPIVEFSIENKVALNKKKHRIESNLKNNQRNTENSKDLPEESIDYSGVMSRPDKPNQKVRAPKVNRKLGEMKKQLKTRKKKIQKNKNKEIKEKRHKINVEKRKLNKKQNKDNFEGQDSHDIHYKKRKHIFRNTDKKIVEKSVKRVKREKWFKE